MQPELFEELPSSPRPRRAVSRLFPGRFLRLRVAYEDLIFVLLSSFLVLLAGFCLGVERGKLLTGVPTGEGRGLPALSSSSPVLPVLPEAHASAQGGRELDRGGSYVIQLASYRDPQAAEKEALRLRRQGFVAQVVKQGKYFELRAAGYRSREEAARSLAALRKTYHDGFIKRL